MPFKEKLSLCSVPIISLNGIFYHQGNVYFLILSPFIHSNSIDFEFPHLFCINYPSKVREGGILDIQGLK